MRLIELWRIEMQFRNTPNRFGLVAQSLHWLTVALVTLAWVLGNASEDRSLLFYAHVAVGLTVLAVFTLRLLWRLQDPPPVPEPTLFGRWGDRLATATHIVLYVLLAAAPLTGIAYQFARGEALPVFGLFEVASPVSLGRATARSIKEAHEVLANALLFVALAHAAAALLHHWILRDRTLKRMLPGAR
jgi:cytochrome b561